MIDSSQMVFAVGKQNMAGVDLLGTCFSVGLNLVATAAHVVGAEASQLLLVLPNVSSSLEYQDTSNTNIKFAKLEVVAFDPIHDLCILKLSGVNLLPAHSLGGTDDSPPGTGVVVHGYPHATFGRLVLTQQTATVGARIMIGSSGIPVKHLVLNIQARDGQSGSPIVDSETGKVVAVLVGSYAPGGGGGISLGGVDPATLHQTTHAVSAEYLEKMLVSA